MSQETTEWLRGNTMLGMVKDKAKWEGNHYVSFHDEVRPWWSTDNSGLMMYEGGIPVDDIRKHLFKFEIATSSLWFPVPCSATEADGINDDGSCYRIVKSDEWQVVYHGETKEIFTVATDRYAADQYERTLLGSAATILSVSQSELQIGSAQLLRGGAVAAITLELPELIETPSGMNYRPFLNLVDSYNKQFSFGIHYSDYLPVCDNGLLGLIRKSPISYTRKHTSQLNVAEARNAMQIMFKQSDDFSKEIEALAAWPVTDNQFYAAMNEVVPIPDQEIGPKGNVSNQAAITRREKKQSELWYLWVADPRTRDWKNTALGAVHSWNTWNSHFSTVRRTKDENGFAVAANRMERNMIDLFRGKQLERDHGFLEVLANITDVKLDELIPV